MLRGESIYLDAIFHALADSTRRSILRDIAEGEKTVSEVAKPYAMSLAAISKHLNVLENARLIVREKKGSFQMVHLKVETMRSARQWLDYYERFWSQSLNNLQKMLEKEKDA